MFESAGKHLKPVSTFFGGGLRKFIFTEFAMDTTVEDAGNDGPVTKDKKYRNLVAADLQVIFYSVRATMVNNRPKHGIFQTLAAELRIDQRTVWRQRRNMRGKLAALLNNQPEEDHIGIIAASSHILFRTGVSLHREGKFKYDRELLQAEAAGIKQDKRPTL